MKRKILVVDDQKINRRILKKILSGTYDILEACDGVEAVEILTQERRSISAVVLDLIMPRMDGYGVLEALSKKGILTEIPVIVASQADKSEMEERALRCGANDFIMKPYNPGILKQRLKNLIELYESRVHISKMERDLLTGIYTKEAFCRKSRMVLSENKDKEYMLVALDIERFKMVNDSYGSEEGDRVLKLIAKELEAQMDKSKSICGRINADHFVVLLQKNGEKLQFRPIAHRLKEVLRSYPVSMKMSLKVGIYDVRDKTVEVELMCDRAFWAVESTKGQYGVSYAYYDDSIRQKMRREQQILDSMRNAIVEKQLEVYLQPKYDIKLEKIAGAEALVRWIHPTFGFMNPGEFIPLFEKNGFITEVDKFVWERTCELIAGWIKSGAKAVPVSVNVSRKDIYQENLPQYFIDLVKRHGLEPKHLHLEITETAYTQDATQLVQVVKQLKEAGFTIEMDDFGSGYSSLNMFVKLPIDILKLDMRFMEQEAEVEEGHDILSFIVDMAKWMKLSIIAEGVETKQQVDRLRSLGCDYVQGYYYSKPLPSKEFEEKYMTV